MLHRMTGLGEKVLWNLGPPRVRIEEAVLTGSCWLSMAARGSLVVTFYARCWPT